MFSEFAIHFKLDSSLAIGHFNTSISCWNRHSLIIPFSLLTFVNCLPKFRRYLTPSILPSIISSVPTPLKENQPRIIMFPPSRFTVGLVLLFMSYAVPFFHQIWVAPLRPKSYICTHLTIKYVYRSRYCYWNVFLQIPVSILGVSYGGFVTLDLVGGVHYWSFFLQMLVPFLLRSVCSSCRGVTKESFLTVRIICRRFLSEIFRRVLDLIMFSVVPDFFHFFTMNFTVLTGAFRALEVQR